LLLSGPNILDYVSGGVPKFCKISGRSGILVSIIRNPWWSLIKSINIISIRMISLDIPVGVSLLRKSTLGLRSRGER
jgi:hypothetical protein